MEWILKNTRYENTEYSRSYVERIMKAYPAGTKVKLIDMCDEQSVSARTMGTVKR